MKISLIVTVFNEEATIVSLLKSATEQTTTPDEMVVVDGGSTDHTLTKIKEFVAAANPSFPINVFTKKGNRSVGRNEAIKKAKGEIILITDAGCILDKNWVKEVIKPFDDKKVDVVAGYYKAKAETVFQKCLVPYALVMPDKVNPSTFLPATRSMAIRKSVWKEVGGFDERYSHNEDYVLARKLKESGKNIVFVQKAIVYWIPRKTLGEAYTMFYRFAYGDAEARTFRPKVVFVFFRYIIGLLLFLIAIFLGYEQLLFVLIGGFVFYLLWAISKNYRYVGHLQAIYTLPVLQLLADWAVLKGTTLGSLKEKISY